MLHKQTFFPHRHLPSVKNKDIFFLYALCSHRSHLCHLSMVWKKKKKKRKDQRLKTTLPVQARFVWLGPGCQSACTLSLKWLPWPHCGAAESSTLVGTRDETRDTATETQENDRYHPTASGGSQRCIRVALNLCFSATSIKYYIINKKDSISYSISLCCTLCSCKIFFVIINCWSHFLKWKYQTFPIFSKDLLLFFV